MKNIFYIFLFWLFAIPLQAQVLFTASADRYEVGVGATFTVTFEVNSSTNRINYPDFNGFTIGSGPMTSRSQQFINGVSSSSTSAQFQLIALQEGTFTIAPASVKINGETYTTKPLTIKVVQKEKPKPNSPESKAAEMAYVKILTNKRKVYVGEPISARYSLVIRTNVGQFEYLAEPEFPGFVKNDIPIKNITTKKENIDGQLVAVADFRKFVLTPQRAGTFKPGDLQLRLPTSVPTGRRDWFGQAEMRTINQITTSKFPTIEVLPLPTANKPAAFTGAVGDFKFNVNVSRSEVKGGESITLSVEVSGKGNIQLVELPTPEIPNSIEQYDPKYSESFDVLPTGIRGKKRNEYLLIPQYKGVYKIPALTFSYFDPYSETYQTVTTDELLINVTEGEVAASQNTGVKAPATVDKNAVSAIGNDILFIHTEPSAFVKKGDSFFASTWHIALAVGLLALILILFIVHRVRKNYRPDVEAKARKNAGSQAKKRLKEAHAKLEANDVNAFYQELIFALQKYFALKTKLPQAEFNQERIAEIIAQKNGDEQLNKNIGHILNQANMARFAPITQANMKADYDLTLESLEKLENLL